MSVPEIIGYVTALLQDWGLMPYIQAGMLITVTIAAIIGVTAWLANR